jgi:hypothetical protein
MLHILAICLAVCATEPAPLPGSDLSIDQAKERATIIVAADLVRYRHGHGSRGVMGYGDVELAVFKVLRGEAAKKELVSFAVKWQKLQETAPEKGKDYLLFSVRDTKGNLQAIKVLRNTTDNFQEAKP